MAELLYQYFSQDKTFSFVQYVNEAPHFEAQSQNVPEITLFIPTDRDSSERAWGPNRSSMGSDNRWVILDPEYQINFSGYYLKRAFNAYCSFALLPGDLMEIIHQVVRHGQYWTASQLEVIADQLSPKIPEPSLGELDRFTPRELQVLGLLAEQMTSAEIGDTLHISSKTVDGHKSRLLQKTGRKNAVGLVVYAIRNRLVDPEHLT